MSTMTVPGPQPAMRLPAAGLRYGAIASAVPKNARWAVFKAEAQTVRIRDDGTDPTAAVGFPLLTTHEPFVYTGNLSGVKAIAATAGGL